MLQTILPNNNIDLALKTARAVREIIDSLPDQPDLATSLANLASTHAYDMVDFLQNPKHDHQHAGKEKVQEVGFGFGVGSEDDLEDEE
jgi:hypothetical protein